jgi:hypothetical protein
MGLQMEMVFVREEILYISLFNLSVSVADYGFHSIHTCTLKASFPDAFETGQRLLSSKHQNPRHFPQPH